MLTIFIDPRIKSIKILEQAIEIIKTHSNYKVVCFFNRHQANFFEEHQLNPVCYSFDEWPLEERNSTLERMVQGFYDQSFKPYTTVEYLQGGKSYRLNILQFLGPHFFLRNLFFPVAKTIECYAARKPLEDSIIIGGAVFFHHVNFCLAKHNARATFYELEYVAPEKQFSLYTVSALLRLVGTVFSRIVLRKKVIILPTGGVTDEVASILRKERELKVVTSIHRLIPVFKLFDFGFSKKYFEGVEHTIEEIFDKESAGSSKETMLAYEIYVDYQKKHSFVKDLRHALAVIRILNLMKPQVIAQLNFNGDTYPFSIWGDYHRVPTISMQHGFQGRFLMNIKYKIESDYYYAWADLPYDHERNPDAVFKPVGNPLFKSLPEERSKIDHYLIKDILLAPGALHYSKADADAEFWRDLLHFFETEPLTGIEVNVKLHRKDRYRDLTLRKIHQHPFPFKLAEGSIRNSLLTCNLVITTVSTVALDAFGFDKPVILVNNAMEDEYYSANNACVIVSTVEQLFYQLRLLSTDASYVQECLEKQRAFYRKFCGDKAAEYMAEDILALANRV